HRDRHPFPTRRSSDLGTCVDSPTDLLRGVEPPHGRRRHIRVRRGGKVECTRGPFPAMRLIAVWICVCAHELMPAARLPPGTVVEDRKSTRLNSSHVSI